MNKFPLLYFWLGQEAEDYRDFETVEEYQDWLDSEIMREYNW